MDRVTVYRDMIPLETHILEGQRFAYEAFGLFARDVLGASDKVAGFACGPTSPASLDIVVQPGRLYRLHDLDPNDWGVMFGQGGLPADTDDAHQIVKQALLRDPATFTITPPATVGQSVKYLVQVTFLEEDDAAVSSQFWNAANPAAPVSQPASRYRRDKAVLNLKAGAPATTGSETIPATDAGFAPLWVITVANGASTITAPNIAAHPSKPDISLGGGGGGGTTLPDWTVLTASATATNKQRYIINPPGAGVVLTLPPTPPPSAEIWVKGKFLTNNVTIARNGQTIEGAASDLVLNKDYMNVHLVFDGATWRV